MDYNSIVGYIIRLFGVLSYSIKVENYDSLPYLFLSTPSSNKGVEIYV